LKGCDLIVAATDNEYSRLFLQTLCAQYLIPLLNLGAVINASAADGTVEDAYGSAQLWLPGKGNPCMSCAGMIDARLVSMELAPEAER
jgi:molybdopterin/thiamine biosynthesis adenylyltransferase